MKEINGKLSYEQSLAQWVTHPLYSLVPSEALMGSMPVLASHSQLQLSLTALVMKVKSLVSHSVSLDDFVSNAVSNGHVHPRHAP